MFFTFKSANCFIGYSCLKLWNSIFLLVGIINVAWDLFQRYLYTKIFILIFKTEIYGPEPAWDQGVRSRNQHIFSSKSVPPMYRSSRIHDPKPKRYSKCDLRANEQANTTNSSSTTRQTRTANRTYVGSPSKRKPRSANIQNGVRSKSKKQRSILGK